MQDALGSVKNAVSRLLDQMRPGDSVAVYGFNPTLAMLQDFTTDKAGYFYRRQNKTNKVGDLLY